MFKPAAIYLGYKYTRAKRGNHFISFISLMSVIGIALGVMVLITTLSVLNGFDREIKKSIFSMMAPITVSNVVGHIKTWQPLEKITRASAGVTAVAPYVSGQALLQSADVTQPVKVVGIIPSKEKGITVVADRLIQGDIAELEKTNSGIVLGENLAARLNLKLGDQLTVITLKGSLTATHITPGFNRFKVVGIFRAGGGRLNYDDRLAFVSLSDAQKIFELGSSVTALHANIADLYAAPRISVQLENQFPASIVVSNWTEQLGDYFENIKLTKTIMFFIFILIIVVAIFNLIGTLVMVVNSKRSDIAILRTIGATPGMIMTIFIVQGAIIGTFGTLLGVAGGILLACNVTGIVNLIQTIFHIQLISSHVYFVDYVPSELQWQDVWRIAVVALSLSLLATLRPAWTASRTAPAEALRYD